MYCGVSTICVYYFSTIHVYYFSSIRVYYFSSIHVYYFSTIHVYYFSTICVYYFSTILSVPPQERRRGESLDDCLSLEAGTIFLIFFTMLLSYMVGYTPIYSI